MKIEIFFRFSARCLTYFFKLKIAIGILFVPKRKVWTFPEKMSTLGAPYDKNSLLSLHLKIFEFFSFFRDLMDFAKMEKSRKMKKIQKFSNATTTASFCRTELLRCSFFQEIAILCVYKQIKFLSQF